MASPNIVIQSASLSRNPVNTGEKLILSVKIVPEQFRIETLGGYIIVDKSGNEIICMEE